MLPAVVVAVAAVMVVAWVVASRRHLDRRERATAEWENTDGRPDLWTSEGACVHCGAAGGLVEIVGDDVVFACLACGRRHVRQTRA